MLKEECKGCAMISMAGDCMLTQMHKQGWMKSFDCPCFKCLVKVMCNSSCEKADCYFNKASELKKKARLDGKKKIDEEILKLWAGYKYKPQKGSPVRNA